MLSCLSVVAFFLLDERYARRDAWNVDVCPPLLLCCIVHAPIWLHMVSELADNIATLLFDG